MDGTWSKHVGGDNTELEMRNAYSVFIETTQGNNHLWGLVVDERLG
jgi:hypothetical protein